MPFIRTTRCLPGWPLVYATYHQEVAGKLRRSDHAAVIRLHRWGVVAGWWDTRASSETAAIMAALGARPEPVVVDGELLARYRPDTEASDVP